MSTFEQLLKVGQEGEKLIDPRTGRYNGAMLVEVRAITQSPETLRIDLVFGNLVDGDGTAFDHTARIFMPREIGANGEETPYFIKARFMQFLKGLGVVPASYTQMLRFQTAEAVQGLAEAINEHVGQTYNLTIGLDNRGFYTTTIRA